MGVRELSSIGIGCCCLAEHVCLCLQGAPQGCVLLGAQQQLLLMGHSRRKSSSAISCCSKEWVATVQQQTATAQPCAALLECPKTHGHDHASFQPPPTSAASVLRVCFSAVSAQTQSALHDSTDTSVVSTSSCPLPCSCLMSSPPPPLMTTCWLRVLSWLMSAYSR